MPNFCSNCGVKLDPNAKFCPNCGNPLSATATPAPVASMQSNISVASGVDELQTELYSLYKILEPMHMLDVAARKIEAKISELSGYQSEISKRFSKDFVYLAPFINAYYDLDEDSISLSDKSDLKSWKAFIKRQTDCNREPFEEGKYDLKDIYRMMKKNESKIVKKPRVAFFYYKMCYVFEEPQTPSKYIEGFVCDKKSKHSISNYKLINYDNFINNYLPKKLGDKYDGYLARLVKGENLSVNMGELQLHDITMGYAYAKSYDSKSLPLYDKSLGFPEIRYIGKVPYNMSDIKDALTNRLKKTLPIKNEFY